MKEFAIACNYEHPVHSLILDPEDQVWKNYFSQEELIEIKTYNAKDFQNLPNLLTSHIDYLKDSDDVSELKSKTQQEQDCPACERVRHTFIDYFRVFKWKYLPLSNQVEGDILRHVWKFIDVAFDDSKIVCRGVERTSHSSLICININRSLAGINKMERKSAGRKIDLVFYRQLLEYGISECGKKDDQTKELNDKFKMMKVLRDMFFRLYKKSSQSIREISLVRFLLFDTKFITVVFDAPAGYISPITRKKTLGLPEEPEDIVNELFPILSTVYKCRIMMENVNKLVKSTPVDTNSYINSNELITSSFVGEEHRLKKKRKLSQP